MTTTPSIQQAIKMVLVDNKGQALTEALCMGIEQSILYYVETLGNAETKMKGLDNGT